VSTLPNDLAKRRNVPGRTPEFQRYMAELALTDPARHAQISQAEAAYVPEHAARLVHEESLYAEQMVGYREQPDA
jgi:hypothetical protein